MANERHPAGRMIIYSLCDLSIKMGEVVQAVEYYKDFTQIAPNDSGRYVLQYKLYEAQDVGLEERIAVLEELKKRDYRENGRMNWPICTIVWDLPPNVWRNATS